jgi:hypothetical protein
VPETWFLICSGSWGVTKYVRHLSLVALVGAGACALVPTVPGGPLQRAGTVQVSEAQVVDMVVGGTTTSTLREDRFHLDTGSSLIFPARVGARVALADWLDAEADWGWSGGGGELRAGATEGAAIPFALSLGGRSGALLPVALDDERDLRQQHELRARLELYPSFALTPGPEGRHVNGVFAAGVSQGVHYHWLPLPDHGGDAPDLPPHESILRDELRIEGAVGVQWRARVAVVSLVAMPYAVARSQAASPVPCGDPRCDQLRQEAAGALRQNYGVSVTLGLGLAFNRRPPRP